MTYPVDNAIKPLNNQGLVDSAIQRLNDWNLFCSVIGPLPPPPPPQHTHTHTQDRIKLIPKQYSMSPVPINLLFRIYINVTEWLEFTATATVSVNH